MLTTILQSPGFRALRAIYSVFWCLAIPGVLARLWWRGRYNPGYREHWAQRFGHAPVHHHEPPVWIHAVSVGETAAAAPLIKGLIALGYSTQLTVTTPTGADKANQLFGSNVPVCYPPFDTASATRQFMNTVQPAIGVIIETEIWPNLLYAAAKAGVPVIFANARLSARSLAGYQRARPLILPTLSDVRLIAAQTETDAARFRRLGVDRHRVETLGNLKYDAAELLPQTRGNARTLRARCGSGPLILAASTHRGDELAILDAFARVHKIVPTAQLLIAPRHPERFQQVANTCRAAAWRVTRVSAASDLSGEILLGDQMGALTTYYAAADLAILGATFEPIGGHNPIEAVLAGCPVVLGPNHHRITEMMTIFADAFVRVHSAVDLAEKLIELVENDTQRQKLSTRATAILARERGVTDRLLTRIQVILSPEE